MAIRRAPIPTPLLPADRFTATYEQLHDGLMAMHAQLSEALIELQSLKADHERQAARVQAQSELVDKREAAAMLKVSSRQIDHLLARKVLERVRIGSLVRIRRADVEELAATGVGS